MAAAILSSVLRLIHCVEDPSLNSCKTMEEDLNQLKQTLEMIRAVLRDAEEREWRDKPVKHWLQELKDVCFDAEDVLDDYQYELLSRSKVQTRAPEPPEEVCDSTHFSFHDGIASSIKGIRKRLEELACQCGTLHLKGENGEGELEAEADPVSTLSCVKKMMIYGREDDRKRVIELLLLDRRSNLSVIPIVGIGGVGKTTLAQLVYNDPMICEQFDLRGWVCVSEDFNLVRLLKSIVASLTSMSFVYTEPSHLQSRIKHELEGRRFLLVLDDVWNEDQSLWECLRLSLTVGLEGSVVLVTTRCESVARFMQTVPFYYLQCLSEEDCWSLFQQCSFANSRDPSARSNLVAIGKGIIKKLKGLPLAAKMIGSLLSCKTDEESWNNILHSDLWDSDDETIDVISSAITLGYYSLPANAKRCFTYCGLFPKDYLFKKDRLVKLWMAEGFIQPVEGKHAEDIGIKYFDELLRRSFFYYSHIDQETFGIHDFIHDLALSISRKERNRMEDGNLCPITSEMRHSSLIPQDFGAAIRIQSNHRPSSLRTFLVIHRLLSTCDVAFLLSTNCLHLKIPNDLFTYLECLRTLDLSETNIAKLPDSIGSLKHLLYLGLSHTKIRSLPESVCHLYHLQTLDMLDCEDLLELPKGTKNLTNLRHLYLPKFVAIVPIPPGIGLLTNLQTLSTFYVGSGGENCVIEELKDLVILRGELDIGGLQNVASVEQVKGSLKDKEYLTKLILRSGVRYNMEDFSSYDFSLFDGEAEDLTPPKLCSEETRSDDESQGCKSNLVDGGIEQKATKQEIDVPNELLKGLEEGVFESLRPHTNLTELVIQSYQSVKFPSWMGDPSFSKLVSVKLGTCCKCRVLPPLGQLPSLRHLVVEELSELEHIDREFCGQDAMINIKGFPSLETLHFGSMYKWEEWVGPGEGEFPCLHELNLNYCPKLRRMPHLLPSLRKLVMWVCEELTVLPSLPSLTTLEILGYCNEKIWSSVSQELLAGLQSLKIHGFKELTSCPLHKLCSLEELEIMGCQEHPSPCSLPLSNLSSLKRLKIHNSSGIWFAPDQLLPSTLWLLDISYCPLLIDWCQRHRNSRLVHISRVILDRKDFHPVDEEDNHQI